MTEQALRKRLARGTMEARKNNRGTLVVLVSNAGAPQAQPDSTAPDISSTTKSTTGQDGVHNTGSPALTGEPGAILISAHQEVVQTLQAALAAARADLESERLRHDAEIGRMANQFRTERGIWTERVDTAEVRAEQATAALNDLVNRILSVIPAPQPAEPWWVRWFGDSRRSDIRGG